MTNILIRDMPAALHRQLKAQATAERRSMNQQILFILESSVSMGDQAAQEGGAPTNLSQPDEGAKSPAKNN